MKFSLSQQIEEVEREISLRKAVYSRRVAGLLHMSQSKADYHLRRMEAVKLTLEWMRDNEAHVRAFAAARNTEGAA